MKIIIEVFGGVVTTVSADVPLTDDVEVCVLDWDDLGVGSYGRGGPEETEALADHMEGGEIICRIDGPTDYQVNRKKYPYSWW